MTGLPRTILLVVVCAVMVGCAQSTATTPPGAVLFQDDFAQPFQGWKVEGTGAFNARQSEGVYRLGVPQPDGVAWATPGIVVGDVRIEVDARKIAGVDDNQFGVICRFADPRDFVFLLISSDGYAGIGITVAGQTRMLSGDAMMPSSAIRTDGEPNHLRAECIGDQMELYVNGQHVASAATSQQTQGDVGVMVAASGVGGVEVSFDNFSALQP